MLRDPPLENNWLQFIFQCLIYFSYISIEDGKSYFHTFLFLCLALSFLLFSLFYFLTFGETLLLCKRVLHNSVLQTCEEPVKRETSSKSFWQALVIISGCSVNSVPVDGAVFISVTNCGHKNSGSLLLKEVAQTSCVHTIGNVGHHEIQIRC